MTMRVCPSACHTPYGSCSCVQRQNFVSCLSGNSASMYTTPWGHGAAHVPDGMSQVTGDYWSVVGSWWSLRVLGPCAQPFKHTVVGVLLFVVVFVVVPHTDSVNGGTKKHQKGREAFFPVGQGPCASTQLQRPSDGAVSLNRRNSSFLGVPNTLQTSFLHD